MKRINYKKGQIVNQHKILFISEEPSVIVSNVKRRKAIFQCECGNNFTSLIKDVIYNKRTSCGCKKGVKAKIYKKGDFINGIKFIKSCGTFKNAQKAIFECPKCKNKWISSVNNIQRGKTKSCCGSIRGWTRSQWVDFSKTSKLYRVRLYNEYESFIKIGITTKTLKERFKYIPYSFEIINVVEGESSYIFDLENRFKRFFKKNKYTPKIDFLGKTECFKI